jgi:hypothetical protein
MSGAVGLKDVFSYGLRFVGYLSLVVLVGGGLLVAGFAFGFSAVLDAGLGALTDPSQLTATLAGGAVVSVVGAVTLVSGVVGLLHKLVADAAMTGTEMALAADVESADDGEDVDAGDDEEPESDTEAEPTESVPGDAESEPGEVKEPPEPVEADEQPEPVEAEEPGPSEDDDSQTPLEPVETDEPAAADEGAEPVEADDSETTAEPAAADEQTQLVERDAGPDGGSTGSEPTDDGDLISESDGEERADAPPEEWSPPDPSEFEFDETGPEENVEDDTGEGDTDGSEEAPRTAADLFGDSDDSDDSEVFDATDDAEAVETDGDADPLSDALDEE